MRKAILATFLGVVLATTGAFGAVGRREAPPPPTLSVAGPGSIDRADLAAVMRRLEDRVAAQPRDGQALAGLGHVYVELSRVTADLGYYAKAEEALDAALALDSTDQLALAGKAALAAARHDFSGALTFADAALRQDPFQATALAIRIDALTELGRYDDQWTALLRANRRSPGPPVLLRLSYAYELRGRLGPAARALRLALAGTRSASDRAFALTLLAVIDRKSGRLDAAARHLRQALQADAAYAPALSGRARLADARGDHRRAARLWQEASALTGSADAAIEVARHRLAVGLDAARQFRALASSRAIEIASGVDMDLEIAQFEADHGSPLKALEAAQREWDRRHSVHVADALAWALRVNGRPGEALRYAVFAVRLGTPDAQFWLHRAAIEADLGRITAARSHLSRALLEDPGVSPWLVAQARAAVAASR